MHEYREEVMKQFVEIEALGPDQFLRLKETLTRIGVPVQSEDPNEKPTLWQSVHVFHSRGRYFLVHFKQMFLYDGRVKSTHITDADLDRLEAVAALAERWGLVRCVDEMPPPRCRVHVLPYAQKDQWHLRAKYNVGAKKFTKESDSNDN